MTWGALSSRIAYKLNEDTGEYEEWGSYVTADNEYGYVDSGYSEPFDMCMGEGLDIFLGSADAGTYKIVGSGTDENGNEWSGEVVLTVDYVADEGGSEDEEPEDPYGFSHLLMSHMAEESETLVEKGYLQPGDKVKFGAVAYYNDGTTASINSENATWSISAEEGAITEGTTIDKTGLLTVAEEQEDLSVINVEVAFTDKNGVEHTKEMSILVSEEDVTLSLSVVDGPYYTGRWYSFTLKATNAIGEEVPMEWTLDMVAKNEGESLDVTVDPSDNSFWADDAGEYYLRAWAEYMLGQRAEIPVTVVEGGAADTTAPTVSSVEGDGVIYTYTIEDVSDADFPMTMNVYWALDENVYAEGVGALYTVEYTLSEDGTVAQTGDVAEAADARVTYENDTVTSKLNTVVTEAGYWGVTVTDASGNMGKLEEQILVEPAIGCFVAGTQVQTVDGLVNIEDIKLGDMVYSIDLTTGAKVVSPVTWVQGTRYIDATYAIYAGGEKVVATYEHPFYVVSKEWVAAEDLTVGDKIKTVDGQVTITDIVYTELDAPVQVYNFTVDGTHNYLISAAGLLVHNIPGK